MGIDHVSTNAIAERAGVGVASVHRYFPNKQAVFAEVARRRDRQFLADLDRLLSDNPSLEVGIERCVRLMVEMDAQEAQMRRTLNVDLPVRWSLAEPDPVHVDVIRRLTAWLLGHLPDVSPEVIQERAFLGLGTLLGVVKLSLIVPKLALEPELTVQRMTRVLVGIVRADEAVGC